MFARGHRITVLQSASGWTLDDCMQKTGSVEFVLPGQYFKSHRFDKSFYNERPAFFHTLRVGNE